MIDVVERPATAPGVRTVPYWEVLVFGLAAAVTPVAFVYLASFVTGTHRWEVHGGIATLVVFSAFAGIAAWYALRLRALPGLIGFLTGTVFAASLLAREGTLLGPLVVLGFGIGGAHAGMARRRHREVPPGAATLLLGLAMFIGVISFLLLRPGPVDAAVRRTGAVLESTTFVVPPDRSAHEQPQSAFVLARVDGVNRWLALAKVERGFLGVWRPLWSYPIPEECLLPAGVGRIQGPDGNVVPGIGNTDLIMIAHADIARVCRLRSERLVIGIAPIGTTIVRAQDANGHRRDVTPGAGGLYALASDPAGTGSPNESLYAVMFLGSRGELLDSRSSSDNGDLWQWAAAAANGFAPTLTGPSKIPATVSMWLIPASSYPASCGIAPADAFVTVIQTTLGGKRTEFVLGDNEDHPFTTDMLDRLRADGRSSPAGNRPCFLGG
ncbi:MAG: hypothetical protein ABR548_05045 [Actinomycetota bacterium]|nr:hypothetical protein [Actinomycetota bacterium]